MDGVSMSRNVQGSTDKNSGAPPWRDMGQRMEFPCLEMCRDLWIKTPVPLPGGIRANGRSFRVCKCAGVCGYKLRCPSLEGYGPMDGVSVSGNVQGSMDKNSGAPPWRYMGQWMEFPCLEMCRGPWIKTPVPLPGDMGQWTEFPCLEMCRGPWIKTPVPLPGDTGQWTEFPFPEMCRGPWIKTPVPLPGGIRANGRSFHVWKYAGIHG